MAKKVKKTSKNLRKAKKLEAQKSLSIPRRSDQASPIFFQN
jgi:hypothetical protein